MQAVAYVLREGGHPKAAAGVDGIAREMRGTEHAPSHVPGVQVDGDLIAVAVATACIRAGVTDAEQVAEAAVVELAKVPGVTVLRGPDSAPWQPAPATAACARGRCQEMIDPDDVAAVEQRMSTGPLPSDGD